MSGRTRKLWNVGYKLDKAIIARHFNKHAGTGSCTRLAGYSSASAHSKFLGSALRQAHPICRKKFATLMKYDTSSTHDSVESMAMYNVIQASERFYESIAYTNKVQPIIQVSVIEEILVTNWEKSNIEELLNAFGKLSYYITGKGSKQFALERYDNILVALEKNAKRFSNKEMSKLLYHILSVYTSIRKSKVLPHLIKELGYRCESYISEMRSPHLLKRVDVFYQLQSNERFCDKALAKLTNRIHKLSAHNYVQLMFYLTFAKIYYINMYELEYKWGEFLDELTLDEAGVVALSFFKREVKIVNPELMRRLIQKITREIAHAKVIPVTAIMKLLRYSFKPDTMDLPEFESAVQLSMSQIKNYPTVSVVHVAHTGRSLGIYSKDLLDLVTERLLDNMNTLTLKDFERSVMALSVSPHIQQDQPLYRKILEQLEVQDKNDKNIYREKEAKSFFGSMVFLLLYLSYQNIYSKKLLRLVFRPEVMRKVRNNRLSDTLRALWRLDCNLRLDLPNYDGPAMNDITREYIAQFTANQLVQYPSSGGLKMMAVDVMYQMKEVLGLEDYMCAYPVMPHYIEKEIICAFDENQKPVKVEPFLENFGFKTMKCVTSSEFSHLKWIAVAPVDMHGVVRNTGLFNSIQTARLRHLQLLGYNVVPISILVWRKHRDEGTVTQYIEDLMLPIINGTQNSYQPPMSNVAV